MTGQEGYSTENIGRAAPPLGVGMAARVDLPARAAYVSLTRSLATAITSAAALAAIVTANVGR